MKKLGVNGRAAIKVIRGKEYVIISAKRGARKLLKGTKYKATSPKVADLVIGSARLGKSAIKGTALSIVLVTAANVLEAVLDDKDLLEKELGFTILIDAGKAVVSGIAGYLAGVAVAGIGAAVTVAGAPVVLVIGAGIVVGIAVGYVLDKYVDTDEIAKAMSDWVDKKTETLLEKGGRALKQLEREIMWKVWPHWDMPFPNY